MTTDAIRTAAIILIVYPTVVSGGGAILWLRLGRPSSSYRDDPLRQRLWTAEHAGLLLILSLVALVLLQYVELDGGRSSLVRWPFPAAFFLPAAYFLSVLDPDADEPDAPHRPRHVGAISLGAGMLTLGAGLFRALWPLRCGRFDAHDAACRDGSTRTRGVAAA